MANDAATQTSTEKTFNVPSCNTTAKIPAMPRIAQK